MLSTANLAPTTTTLRSRWGNIFSWTASAVGILGTAVGATYGAMRLFSNGNSNLDISQLDSNLLPPPNQADLSITSSATLPNLNPLLPTSLETLTPLLTPDTQITTENLINTLNPTRRRLLTNPLTVANPLPNKVIDASATYSQVIDAANIFNGDVRAILVSNTSQANLPSWLHYQPQASGWPLPAGSGLKNIASIKVVNDIAYVVIQDSSGQESSITIFNVGDPNKPALLNVFPMSNSIPADIDFSSNVAFIPAQILGSGNNNILGAYATVNSINLISAGNCLLPTPISRLLVLNNQTIIGISKYMPPSVFLTINTTNLSNMRVGNSFLVQATTMDFVLNDTTIFIATDKNIQALNFSNPYNVTTLATYSAINSYGSLYEYWGIAISGNMVYTSLSNPNYVIQIYNFTNQSTFIPLANNSLTTVSNTRNLVIQYNMLYITTQSSSNQVLIFNILDLTNIALIASHELRGNPLNYMSGTPRTLCVANGNIFVIEFDSWRGFQIINPTQGLLSGTPTVSLLGNTYSISVQATDAFGNKVTDSFTLYIDQLPQPIINTLLEQSVTPGQLFSLSFSSSALYTNPDGKLLQLSAAQTNNQLLPTWLTFSMSPQLMGSFIPRYVNVVQIIKVENFLYALDDFSVIEILDVSVPTQPTLINSYFNFPTIAAFINRITHIDNFIYAHSTTSIYELDATNLRNITLTNSYDFTFGASISLVSMFISNTTLCLFPSTSPDWHGFLIVNLNNSSGLTIIANQTIPPDLYQPDVPIDLDVSNNRLYLLAQHHLYSTFGVLCFDISNFNNIVSCGNYVSPYHLQGIVINEDVAFLSYIFPNGLEFLDITNPTSPVVLTNFLTDNSINSVTVDGPTLFVCTSEELLILNIRDLRNPILLGKIPTPTFTIVPSGTIAYLGGNDLEVLDLTKAQFSGTPQSGAGTDFGDENNYPILLTATDTRGGTISSTFTIRVEGAPRFMVNSSMLLLQATVGKTLSFSADTIARDPNNDPITFSATELDDSPLIGPSLNSIDGNLIWTPTTSDAGNKAFIMRITDNIAGANQLQFTVHVTRGPEVVLTIPTPPTVILNQQTMLTLPPNFIISPEGLPLTFTAKLLGSNLGLPSWIVPNLQNPANISFMINPIETGSIVIQMIATDPNNAQATTSITINAANFYPLQLAIPPFDQTATAGDKFSMLIQPNTFVNPNGGPVYYSVEIEGNAPWLHWDETKNTLSGKPSHGDTNLYAVRVVPVNLLASNCPTQSQNTNSSCLSSIAKFNINVGGTSWGQYAVTYSTTIFSGLGVFAGFVLWCIYRAKFVEDSVVQLHDPNFKRELDVSSERIGVVQAFRKQERPKWDPRFWNKGYLPLPGGDKLPRGICYDEKTNSICSSGEGPQKEGEWVIQVLEAGTPNNILREFNLRVTPSAAGQSSLRSIKPSLEEKSPAAIELQIRESHESAPEDENPEHEESVSRNSLSK